MSELKAYAKPPALVELCLQAGACTRPLLSSTQAGLISEPFHVQFVTSHDPSIYCAYPTYPSQTAYVELRSGRVEAPACRVS